MTGAFTKRGVLKDIDEEVMTVKGCCGCCCAMLLVFLLIVPASLSRVESTEIGLAYDDVWKEMGTETLTEGLKTIAPYGYIIKYPLDLQTVTFDSHNGGGSNGLECNSKDGINVLLQVTFQFQVKTDKISTITEEYINFESFAEIIKTQTRSSIRHACSNYTASEFQTKRGEVQALMEENVSDDLDFLDTILAQLQLSSVQRPESYEDAVQEKETARTEIDLAVNERDQEILKIEAEVLRGEQQVLEILDTAYTNANVTILEAKVNAEAVVYLIQTYQDYFTRAKSTLGFSEPEEVLQWFENRLYSNKDKTMSVEFPSQIGYGVHANGDADEAGN